MVAPPSNKATHCTGRGGVKGPVVSLNLFTCRVADLPSGLNWAQQVISIHPVTQPKMVDAAALLSVKLIMTPRVKLPVCSHHECFCSCAVQ